MDKALAQSESAGDPIGAGGVFTFVDTSPSEQLKNDLSSRSGSIHKKEVVFEWSIS